MVRIRRRGSISNICAFIEIQKEKFVDDKSLIESIRLIETRVQIIYNRKKRFICARIFGVNINILFIRTIFLEIILVDL